VQKYLHNLKAWNSLPVEQQEHAIGRGKADNVEMAEELKPANAHTVLTVLTGADGNELKIVRDNIPSGVSARLSSAPISSAMPRRRL
jgi:putative iron-dependent peroxidase